MVNTSQSRPVSSRLSLRKNEGVHVQSDDEFEFGNDTMGDRIQDEESSQVEKVLEKDKEELLKRSNQTNVKDAINHALRHMNKRCEEEGVEPFATTVIRQ